MKTDNINNKSDSLLDEQLKQLFQHLSTTNAAVLLIGLFVVWILWEETPQLVLTGWLSYLLILALLRSFLGYQYKSSDGKRYSSTAWLRAYLLGILASGFGWGLATILLVPAHSIFHLIMLIFIQCGLVSGAAASLSSLRYGFSLFSLPCLVPGMIYLAYIDKPFTQAISVCIFTFLIFITLVALRIHKTIIYSINEKMEMAQKLVEIEKKMDVREKKIRTLEKQLTAANKRLQLLGTIAKQNPEAVLTKRFEDGYKEDKLRNLIGTFEGGIWDWNVKRNTISFSEGWLEMLGYDGETSERDFDFWSSAIHPLEKIEVLNKLNLYLDAKARHFVSTHRMRNKNGDWTWVTSHCTVLAWGTNYVPLQVVGYDMKISASDQELTEALQLSVIDETAFVLSFDKYKQQLERIINTTRDSNATHVICHIDATLPANLEQQENIKHLSHQFAHLLLRKCRQRDILSDLGQLRFGLVMEHCQLDVAWRKIKELRKFLIEHDFSSGDALLHLDVSIGITPIDNSSQNVEQVLKDVSHACSTARSISVDQVYIVQRNNDGFMQKMIEKDIVAQIMQALETDNFRVNSTLLNSMKKSKMVSDDLYLIDIILVNKKEYSLADNKVEKIIKQNDMAMHVYSSFINALFTWLSRQPKKYNEAKRIYFVSINKIVLTDEVLTELLIDKLKQNKLHAHALCFMFNDEIALQHNELLLRFLKKIRPMGCRFALEKVSVDTINKNTIKQLNPDFVKISDELIKTIESRPESLSAIKYINEISHILQIKTIAHDVDRKSLFDSLAEVGVDYISAKTMPTWLGMT